MTPTANRDEIGRALALLFQPGDVVELRAPGSAKGTISGYFDDFDALASVAVRLSGTVPAAYVTLNPVNPNLLVRAANRIRSYAKHTTSDADIVTRRWMLFDFDPIRPAGISSTDAEHDAAISVMRSARTWLVETVGFPTTSLVLADSGNGGHALARIDLPNAPEALALVRRCLEAAALACNTSEIVVDTTVSNAARIVKLYGTVAAKGDPTIDRPHRLARLIEVPA
jgi:hypothetical protein